MPRSPSPLGHRSPDYWHRPPRTNSSSLNMAVLPAILTVLGAKGAQGFSIANFFLCPTDVLYFSVEDPRRAGVRKNDSPLTLLRRVGLPAVGLVIQHAERFGEHGAT